MVLSITMPASLCNTIKTITDKDNPKIVFAVESVKEVDTLDGKAMQLNGTSNKLHFGDQKYTEFLLSVGSAISKGPGISCFFWRDQYWAWGVTGSGVGARYYGKGGRGIHKYILYPITNIALEG